MQIHYERINIMETIKNFISAAILISMLSACGCTNDVANVTSSPAPTESPSPSPTAKTDNNIMEDTGDAIQDAGNAVGNTVEGITDAAGDAMK